MKRKREGYLHDAEDDGLPADTVGAWAEEKYRRLGMYAEIFSRGMKNRFEQRVYIDLFAGSGHVVFRESRRRVLGSPLIALNLPDPFTMYIFCEEETAKLEALQRRAAPAASSTNTTFVPGDANANSALIVTLLPHPSPGNRVLSFCFVDPYDIGVHFDTIRRLADNRLVDFLILLAVGMDANRNMKGYLKPKNRKMDRFLGDAGWRPRWTVAQEQGKPAVQFLAEEYTTAMVRIGYIEPGLDRMIPVRTRENNMLLYYLAFFSKHERGYEFWDEVVKYSTPQTSLF